VFVSFNPMVQNNRQQKTNFKALPIKEIIKNAGEARRFASAASDGSIYKGQKILPTVDNKKDLLEAIKQAPDPEILSHLEDTARNWGVEFKPKN